MECRLCGSKNLKSYYTQGDNEQYKYYKCYECDLVNYDLSGGLNQDKYTIEYLDPNLKYHKINRDQIATYNFIKNRIESRGNLLDIGCGNGRLLLSAKEDGWNVQGIELSEEYAKQINNRFNINVLVENFFDYKNELGTFDVITLRHVLEHLPDPVLTMNKINESLNLDGYGILEFPNIESVNLKLKRYLNKSGIANKTYGKDYIPGHCNEFSNKSFNYLVKKTGFKLLHWELYSSTHKYSKALTFFNISAKARVLIQKIS